MAETVISAFLSVIFEKLASAALTRLGHSEGTDSQLKKLEVLLNQIRSVLTDAQRRHITDTDVQQWLNELQELAYDMEDALDDLTTEAMRRELTEDSGASSSKVRKIIAGLSAGTSRHERGMNHKLNDFTDKLQVLLDKKKSLGLNENSEKSNKMLRRMETSLVDESRIVGRQGDKEVLQQKLLRGESCNENVTVVPIVSLGGIGKTTLAQLLYNDKQVKDHFDLMAWVCVSDELDIFNISKIIFQSVTGHNQDFADLNLLQVALKEKLSGKRFLFALDDVWSESYADWGLLARPFSVGAPGSKVVVTTRKAAVASVMGSFQPYQLQVLSHDEALSLFAQQALGENNFDSHPTFKTHGEAIVEKCGSLPLALMTLGRVLRQKASEEEWKAVLNSEIWTLRDTNEILPALRLSYEDLPPHLKRLFAYCSLFPKDYVFDTEELVLLWMAEGFLQQSSEIKAMEILGRQYFDELLSRSFFQHEFKEKSLYVMHDLMNDLATSIAGDFFFRLDDTKNVALRNEALEKYRHLSFIRQINDVYGRFKTFERAKSLRTFLAVSVGRQSWLEINLSNKVLDELIPQLPLLRVLSLSHYVISEIPASIGSLKHLRYLNLSRTKITHLPEQICNLYNLQTLLVSGCESLTKLPNSFEKLINLRHLDMSDTPCLKNMPLGIGELKSLQTLSKVIIEGANGFAITKLKGLNALCGRLSIDGLDKVKNAKDANEANLWQKTSINDLQLKWSDEFVGGRNETLEQEVLQVLKPHSDKLKKLGIVYYGGVEFPSWVGDRSFHQLTHLTIRGCKKCICLPSLGRLSSLKELFIEGMDGVKVVGSEFLIGTGNSSGGGVVFPSLEILSFVGMEGWELWPTNSGGGEAVFPRLWKLCIQNCPKLVEVSVGALPSLRELEISGCFGGVLRSVVRVASSVATLRMERIAGLIQLNGGVLEYLEAIENLQITRCDEMRCLWESEAEACKILVKLRQLRVVDCKKMVCLGEKEEVNCESSLTSLIDLRISCCPELEWLKLPPSLKLFGIWGCEKLLVEEESGGEQSREILNSSMTSLEYLITYEWKNLKRLPDMSCFIHLIHLEIGGCEGIESLVVLPVGLRILHISDCRNLKSFPDDEFPSLTFLTTLSIRDCPNMDSSFPGGVWPPNLSDLEIGGLKKPMSEWGPQNFPTSLGHLHLIGRCAEEVSSGSPLPLLRLPSSLTYLFIRNFEKLESLSTGLQHLTSLQHLRIWDCPNIIDLPETLLPSLLTLDILNCPKLEEKCSRSSSSR